MTPIPLLTNCQCILSVQLKRAEDAVSEAKTAAGHAFHQLTAARASVQTAAAEAQTHAAKAAGLAETGLQVGVGDP